MDTRLIVQIRATFDGNEKTIGTGYPIGEGRILTARHVVCKQESRGSDLKVVWSNLGEEERKPVAASIVWPPDGDVDLAILEAAFPPSVKKRFGCISRRPPRAHEQWSSHGFGDVGRGGGNSRALVSMKGTCFAPSGDQLTFDLEVDATASLAQGWRGVSGAPVYVGSEIKGVIVQCPEHYNQSRLRAMPLWRLLDDEGFRKAANLFDDKHRKSVERVVAEIIKNNSDLYNELRKLSDVGICENDNQFEIANKVLMLPMVEILINFEKICRKWDKSGWPPKASPESICDIVFLSIPYTVDDSIFSSLDELATGGGPTAPVNINTPHVAEAAMARWDKRKISGEVVRDNGVTTFRASHAIPLPPANGLLFSVESAVADVTAQLVKEYAQPSVSNYDDLIKIVDDVLADFSILEMTKYMAFHDFDQSNPGFRDSFINRLRSIFKSLLLIPLNSEGAVARGEGRIPRPIEYFLELSARKK